MMGLRFVVVVLRLLLFRLLRLFLFLFLVLFIFVGQVPTVLLLLIAIVFLLLLLLTVIYQSRLRVEGSPAEAPNGVNARVGIRSVVHATLARFSGGREVERCINLEAQHPEPRHAFQGAPDLLGVAPLTRHLRDAARHRVRHLFPLEALLLLLLLLLLLASFAFAAQMDTVPPNGALRARVLTRLHAAPHVDLELAKARQRDGDFAAPVEARRVERSRDLGLVAARMGGGGGAESPRETSEQESPSWRGRREGGARPLAWENKHGDRTHGVHPSSLW
jgi:hypothetical protein